VEAARVAAHIVPRAQTHHLVLERASGHASPA
jgi:hypothetical protein